MNTAIIKLKAAEELERRKKYLNYSSFSSTDIFITDKKGNVRNLVPNSIQSQINDKIEELRQQGIPPRIIVLKARQEGVSTNQQGRIIWHTTTKKNRNALIVAHMDKSTRSIFEKAKFMYERLPIKPLQKASNATELIFDKPLHYSGDKEGLNSKIVIQVAGSNSIGRGDTFHYVHLSEYAFWPGNDDKSPSNQLTGILQSVPNEPDTEVVIESTANGFNDFKTLWDDAVKGENAFTPMFFAWWQHDEYIMELEETPQQFISTMSEYEKYLYNGLKLPLERIKWWRWALKNKCNGNINMMKQENPSTPEEAFIFSGSPIFNIDKVMQRINILRELYKKQPPKRGYFYFEWNNPEIMDIPKPETICWVNDKNGCITIYEDPKLNNPYAIGGDTKGDGSDLFAGTVKNNNTGKRCATLHGQMQSKYYTAQMLCMGYYYNEAVIGIETNFNTYPIELLSDWHYPRQYVRQKLDTFGQEMQKQYGWKTDGNTRPLIIEREITLIEENIDNFTDLEFLNECLTFVKGTDGRPDAMSGKHDDILFSDMICEATGDQQAHIIEVVEVPDDDEDEEDKPKGSSFFD